MKLRHAIALAALPLALLLGWALLMGLDYRAAQIDRREQEACAAALEREPLPHDFPAVDRACGRIFLTSTNRIPMDNACLIRVMRATGCAGGTAWAGASCVDPILRGCTAVFPRVFWY